MQPQVSNPQPNPQGPVAAPPKPVASPRDHHSPKRGGAGKWWLLALVCAASAAGVMYWRGKSQAEQASSGAHVTRTFTVSGGKVERILRLTGTTQAEKYVSMMTPLMRGSRSGAGRNGPSGSFGQRGSQGSSSGRSSSGSTGSSSGATTPSSSSGSGASGTAGSGTVSSASGSADPTAVGAAGSSSSGGRSGSAMRAATSRTGGGGATRSAAANSARSGSAAMGSGLGSTADSLPGGSSGPSSVGSMGGGGGGGRGGGGGGGEFSMVLQEAVKPGSHVKKGDVVAEFDRQYMLTRLDDYKASVEQSEASFASMLANLETTKETHQQSIEMAKANLDKARLDTRTIPVRSDMDAERLRLALEEAQARYDQILKEVKFVDTGIAADRKVAELELQQTRLELRRAEANANRMVMKAPLDGLVVMQNTFRGSEFDAIKVGDQLSPGQNFMQIVDPSSMVINATVSQVDVEKLKIGLKARVRFDAFPGLELAAHVYALGSVAKSARFRPDWVKEMPVSIKLDQMDKRVIPDLSVSVDVIVDAEDAGTIVPLEAVMTDGATNANGEPYLLVRTGNGRWERRKVELGLVNHVQTVVKSGVKAGEVVALEKPASSSPEAEKRRA